MSALQIVFGFVWLFSFFFCSFSVHFYPQQGTADAEIKVPSAGNPAQTNALLLKPGVGQNTATHPCSFSPVFISTFQVHSPSFLPYPLPTL